MCKDLERLPTKRQVRMHKLTSMPATTETFSRLAFEEPFGFIRQNALASLCSFTVTFSRGQTLRVTFSRDQNSYGRRSLT